MTRGTAILLTNGKYGIKHVYKSCEFNGDMYRAKDNGNGDAFAKLIHQCNTLGMLQEAVEKFNVDFKYNYEKDYVTAWEATQEFPDFTTDKEILMHYYFPRFFSDWIFIKNNCDFDVTIKTEDSETKKPVDVVLKSTELIALYFGTVDEDTFMVTNEGIKEFKL